MLLHRVIHPFRLLLLAIAIPETVRASDYSSSYVSVSALNKYGRSVQLEHARQASDRYGRTVVAGTTNEGDVVVVSVYTPGIGVVESDENISGGPYMVHPLQSTVTSNRFGVSLVCTGVKADVFWLVKCLRDYNKRVWERFDDIDDNSYEDRKCHTQTVIKATSTALLDFMGYNRQNELTDGAGLVVPKNDERNQWARPLGVQTWILAPGFPITLIQPSGVAQHFHAHAMGKDSVDLRAALERRFNADHTTAQVKELLLELVKEKAKSTKERTQTQIVVEILSKSGGIQKERL